MGELRLSISDELHKKLKQRALDKEITLKQLIVEIFESYTSSKKSEASKMEKED